jgi:hypothetical protein
LDVVEGSSESVEIDVEEKDDVIDEIFDCVK